MTGEVTLRGNVLPIGGLNEKLLAAKRAGMTTVLVPEDNRKDVQELQAEVTNDLTIVYISHADEAVRVAFADASTANSAGKQSTKGRKTR